MSAYDQRRLFASLGERLIYRAETGSTNDEALDFAKQGAEGGLVILAGRQRAGRGRRGAEWFCGENAGLAFSVLLRPALARPLWPRLALVAGLAVARAIERMGGLAEVKWPNDVLMGGKKVCGILVESEMDAVVVGIGINVGEVALPPRLASQATSLESELVRGPSREDVLLEVVAELDSLAQLAVTDFRAIIEMLRSRCALSGRRVSYLAAGERRVARCRGLGEGGELLIESGGRMEKLVQADEIRPLT
ncbi:MAG: biotin--[acetyl-CoA-carboxylase] ligase [Verrucomicrobiota bacterium JB023]|nr:biotin--[acetyl-CoA-carboxylase] ligase [Verrucomicrobiota bacterium JB023]